MSFSFFYELFRLEKMKIKDALYSNYKSLKKKKFDFYIYYIFLLIYASFLLFICNRLGIWEDEAYSLYTSAKSLSNVINLSYYFENQPPVYFFILALWRKINDGIFFARLLSIIFTFLSAFVLNKLLRLVFEKNYTKWVIVLFLLNPFTIWASQEIRLYSLLILLSLLASYLFYLIYYHKNKLYKFLFILICLLGAYTQYYFTFLIISFSIIILISKGWRSFFNFCLLCVPIFILFLPNLLFIKAQYSVNHDEIIEGYTFIQRIKTILTTFHDFFFDFSLMPPNRFFRWATKILIGFLLLNSLYKIYSEDKRHNYRDFRNIMGIFTAIISSLTIFILLTSFARGLIYSNKYTTIAFPLICLLYATFAVYQEPLKRIIYVSISLYFITILIANYKYPFVKDFNYIELAKFAQKSEQKKEPIIFYNKALAFTFDNYYKGNNLHNPLTDYISDHSYYEGLTIDTLGIIKSIDKAVAKSGSILLITVALPENADSILQKRYSSEYFLNKNYKNSFDTIISGKFGNANLRIRRLSKS